MPAFATRVGFRPDRPELPSSKPSGKGGVRGSGNESIRHHHRNTLRHPVRSAGSARGFHPGDSPTVRLEPVCHRLLRARQRARRGTHHLRSTDELLGVTPRLPRVARWPGGNIPAKAGIFRQTWDSTIPTFAGISRPDDVPDASMAAPQHCEGRCKGSSNLS